MFLFFCTTVLWFSCVNWRPIHRFKDCDGNFSESFSNIFQAQTFDQFQQGGGWPRIEVSYRTRHRSNACCELFRGSPKKTKGFPLLFWWFFSFQGCLTIFKVFAIMSLSFLFAIGFSVVFFSLHFILTLFWTNQHRGALDPQREFSKLNGFWSRYKKYFFLFSSMTLFSSLPPFLNSGGRGFGECHGCLTTNFNQNNQRPSYSLKVKMKCSKIWNIKKIQKFAPEMKNAYPTSTNFHVSPTIYHSK